ncbi:hypothetical protein, partial [Polaromonas sp. P5_E6]
PTLLVEGDDDIVVFRKLEELHADISLSLMTAGGRSSLLKVFERKEEITNTKLGFIADRDSWAITGIPEGFSCPELIFTSGYSIENDLFSDGDVLNMIEAARRPNFLADLNNFVEWFALELSRYIRGEGPGLDLHVRAILDQPNYRNDRMQLMDGEDYPTELRTQIMDNYVTLVRGKNLIELGLRHLTVNGRSLFHALGLMQMIAHRQGPALNRVFEAVGVLFTQQQPNNPDQLPLAQ